MTRKAAEVDFTTTLGVPRKELTEAVSNINEAVKSLSNIAVPFEVEPAFVFRACTEKHTC